MKGAAVRIAGTAAVFTFALFERGPWVQTATAQVTPTSVAITHVTVIDVEHGRRLAGRTVLVEGTRIAYVGPSASAHLPAGARVVNGRGKYLIPGLWDMHVHALQNGRAPWMFPLFIATGVTGIRDTGAPLDSLLYYRPRLRAGVMLGPRLVATGPILDEPPGPSLYVTTPVTSAEQGRRTVDSLADAGVDFIKVYTELTRDEFYAIAIEARRRGIPIVGHVPLALSAFEASDAGLKSIEHLTRVPDACIPDSLDRELDAEDKAAHARRPAISPDSEQAMWVRMDKREAAAFDEEKCEQAGAHFARNGTWQVPTLELYHREGRRFLASDTTRTDSRLRYVASRELAQWMRYRDSKLALAFGGQDNDSRYQTYTRVVRALVRGGDGVLAGTDVGNQWVLPGFGLQGELVAFVRDVGLTPLEALRSATLGPAQFLGATDSLGTVAQGKLADLVLLDADPLVDIRNTQRIRAVVTNGRYFDRAALDSLLLSAERRAAALPRTVSTTASQPIAPNDNRIAAGRLSNGILTVHLDAGIGVWQPDGAAGHSISTAAFGEEGKSLETPGPLIRIPLGTEVRATVRNSLDTPIWIYGMGQLRGWSRDSVRVASGAVRELRFRPTAAGAYYYTARIEGYSSDPRADDSQLTGVIIVDAKGAHPRASDRIFAITSWAAPDSTTLSGLSGRGPNGLGHVFNGRAYPGNERLELTQGDSAHWTFVNLSRSDHPLHLHGFYFRVDARGDGHQDTLYSAAQRRMAVTEYMLPGETMAMSWSPNRSGNWIFHCHFAGHISPRSSLEADRTSMRAPPMTGMANHMTGLVLGITVKPTGAVPRPPEPARNIRLIVRSQPKVYGKYVGYSFALGGSSEDSARTIMRVPGPVLELTRGERVAITIVNQSHDGAAVHWHGIELDSYPDGVPGVSGSGHNILPLIRPGDSLTVRFTPPRAGTFMYHSHSNEFQQISSGLYGALIVRAPGEHVDSTAEKLLLLSDGGPLIDFMHEASYPPALLNGEITPKPIEIRGGAPTLFRLINIRADFAMSVTLLDGTEPARWRILAKDGMPATPLQSVSRAATMVIGPGETYDLQAIPRDGASLSFRYGLTGADAPPEWRRTKTVPIHVRPVVLTLSDGVHRATPKLSTTFHPDLAVRIDSIVENARKEFKFEGVSVVVMRGRAVVVSKGYGLANMSTGTPATARTIYGIGSLSKQITAAAIMKLVEDGRVQLDAPVARYLPELAVARDTSLRIRTLLQQTSGLSVFDDYPEVDSLGLGPDSTMFPFQRVVAMIGAHAPLYHSDSWWSYNNSNYTLLAAVIERVTGLTYDEYLSRALFRPLGMTVTRSCSPTAGTDPARAVGYEIAGDSLVVRRTREYVVPSMTGPGGLCSSVAELANWTRALVDGRAVTPASYRAMTSTRAIKAGAYGTFTPPYGFGVSVLPFAGQAAVWHTGVREGFMSVLVYLPKQDIIVAAATNTRHTRIDALAVRIVRELLATPAPTNLNLAISTREAARTVGSYDDEMFKLRVFQDSNRLFVEVPDLGVREQLLYQGDHLFVATGPRELRFQFDSVQGPARRVDWEWSELRAYGKRTK